MAGTSSYTKPYDLNQPLYGDGLAEVLESKSSKFKKGDKVVSYEMPWCDTSVVHESKLKIKPDVDDEAALSCCGMTGQTAFLGLETIGRPKVQRINSLLVLYIYYSKEKLAWYQEQLAP